jgi:hypothetical protein
MDALGLDPKARPLTVAGLTKALDRRFQCLLSVDYLRRTLSRYKRPVIFRGPGFPSGASSLSSTTSLLVGQPPIVVGLSQYSINLFQYLSTGRDKASNRTITSEFGLAGGEAYGGLSRLDLRE